MASADEDVARAVVRKWRASSLPSLVPGGLEQDRLGSFQPEAPAAVPDANPQAREEPYAKFKVDKLQEPELSTGGQYIDHRAVLIEIRGPKSAVSNAVDAARALYMQQPLPMASAEYPKVVGEQAMAVLEIATDDLRKDETPNKQGEDIWIGEVSFHVMTHRTY